MRKPRLLIALFAIAISLLASVSHAQGVIEWQMPTERENGTPLAPEEIGGYELRYQSGGVERTVIIDDGAAIGYDLSGLEPPIDPGQSAVDLAVYDTNGLYSEFVTIPIDLPSASPPAWGSPPVYTPPPAFDPANQCETDVFCWIDSLNALRAAQ